MFLAAFALSFSVLVIVVIVLSLPSTVPSDDATNRQRHRPGECGGATAVDDAHREVALRFFRPATTTVGTFPVTDAIVSCDAPALTPTDPERLSVNGFSSSSLLAIVATPDFVPAEDVLKAMRMVSVPPGASELPVGPLTSVNPVGTTTFPSVSAADPSLRIVIVRSGRAPPTEALPNAIGPPDEIEFPSNNTVISPFGEALADTTTPGNREVERIFVRVVRCDRDRPAVLPPQPR